MNTTFQLGQATQDNAALELPSELLTQLKSEARASKKTAVALIGEWLQQRELSYRNFTDSIESKSVGAVYER